MSRRRIWSETPRYMGKGAKAMIAACLFPEPEKGGRGKKAPVTGGFTGVDQRRVSEARTVLALAPDLVEEVKAGQTSLADAYKTAQDRKKARERKEHRGIKQLRQLAPDLADRVEDEADSSPAPASVYFDNRRLYNTEIM